ncbi:MAG: regulatory protein GemA [Lachnospiraceae bacterium]
MAEPTIRMLWAIAKSPELSLSSEELHMLVEAHTGKESVKLLNKRELGKVVGILQNMKDSAAGIDREKKRRRGNSATENQRKKIYMLTKELGWNKPARLNGFCKRMFNVSSVEWLNYQQCSNLIEALKKMVERENENGESESTKDSKGV